MKTLPLFRILALALALVALTGCATRQKIDWSARVGNYTFDQAVLDFGPPTKQAKLTDGTLVAEWQTQRGYAQTYYPPAPATAIATTATTTPRSPPTARTPSCASPSVQTAYCRHGRRS